LERERERAGLSCCAAVSGRMRIMRERVSRKLGRDLMTKHQWHAVPTWGVMMVQKDAFSVN